MKDSKEDDISELQIKVTAKSLVDKSKPAAIILAKIYQTSNKHEILATKDIITLALEDVRRLYKNVVPRSLLYHLRSLEKANLVEPIKPLGKERPTYWKLTETGKKVAEVILQELEM